jgi:hypothetical protein
MSPVSTKTPVALRLRARHSRRRWPGSNTYTVVRARWRVVNLLSTAQLFSFVVIDWAVARRLCTRGRLQKSVASSAARYVALRVEYAARLLATDSVMDANIPDGPPPAGGPIGVFDSGVGGLTVLRALCERLPHENFVYLGDTARLPYGTKSAASIRQYALQAARLLHERGVKCLVVACNTASAVALDAFDAGVRTGPGAGRARAGRRRRLHVRRAPAASSCLPPRARYVAAPTRQAIARLRPAPRSSALACPLFVALAEEGWTDGPVVDAVIQRYLDDMFSTARGCHASRYAGARVHALSRAGARASRSARG